MRNNSPSFYGIMSLLLLVSVCVVMTSFLLATTTEFVYNMRLSTAQVEIAQAQRDSIIGVAVAQENGATDRTRITEETKVRTHWSFIPNRFVDIIFVILVALTGTYVVSLILGSGQKR